MDRLVERAVALWDQCQNSSGWSVDPNVNRVILAFQLLRYPPAQLSLISREYLAKAIDQAAAAAESGVNRGLTCFLQSGIEGHAPTYGKENGINRYEARMTTSNGQYTIFPTSWQIWEDGSGAEVHVHHEDNNWFLTSVNERHGHNIQAGMQFSPDIKMKELQQFLIFVRYFSHAFEDTTHVKIIVDYSGIKNRAQYRGPLCFADAHAALSNSNQIRNERIIPLSSLDGNIIGDTAKELLSPALNLFCM